MRRYLIVANRTLGGDELTKVCQERTAQGPCHFHVLVPLTHPDHYADASGRTSFVAGPRERGRVESEAEARHQAEKRLEYALERLGKLGAEVDGELGSPDPMDAITHALVRERYDEIILSTLPPRMSRWLGADLPSRVKRRFGLPLTHVVVES